MASSSGQDDSGKVNWQWSGDDMNIDRSKGPKLSELKSSRAYSVATPAADKSRREPLRANNPGSIPTAGGRSLGQGAREERERRKSRMSSDMGTMPTLDKEGSPDPATQNNTQANTIPQRMAEENGEGSSKVEEPPAVEDKAVSNPAPDVQVTNSDGVKADEPTTDDPKVDEPKTDGLKTDMFETNDTKTGDIEENKDAVTDIPAKKENEAAAAPPAKERRGSRLDDVLGKLKLGGKKK